MSAYISIKEQLAAAFNKAKDSNWKWEDLEVRAIALTDFSYPPQYRTTNTLITLGHGDDVVNVGYDRIPVADHVVVPEGIKFALPKTANGRIRQLAPYLERVIGLEFDATDFVDETYVLNSNLANINLRIAPTSLRWMPGGVIPLTLVHRFRLRNGVCEMMPIQYNHTPDQWYTDHQAYSHIGTRASPVLLTADNDYTPIRNILRNVAVYDAYTTDRIQDINGFDQQLAAAMASVDGLPWVIAADYRNFNLKESWVVYNGPTAGARGWAIRSYQLEGTDLRAVMSLVNPEYDRVLIFRLHERICTNLQSNMVVLHYNEEE